MKSLKNISMLLSVIFGLTVGIAACSSSESKPMTGGELDLRLVSKIPVNSFGFIHSTFAGEAYEAFLKSKWGKLGNGSIIENISAEQVEVHNLLTELQKAGLNIEAPHTFCSELVLFMGADVASSTFGAIAETKKAGEILTVVKDQQSKAGRTVEALTVLNANEAFVVKEPMRTPGMTKEMFFGTDGAQLVVTNTKQSLEAVFANDPSVKKPLLSESNMTTLKKSLGAPSKRLSIAFIDLATVRSQSGPNGLEVVNDIAQFADRVVGESYMDETPKGQLAVSFNKNEAKVKEYFSLLKVSSPKELSATLTTKPMTMISFDGSVFKLLEKMSQDADAQKNVGVDAKEFENLKSADRFTLFADSVPVGQSFLPIPGITVVASAENPAEFKKNVVEKLQGVMGFQVSDRDVGGLAVTTLMSPGFQLFVSSLNNYVVTSLSQEKLAAMNTHITSKQPSPVVEELSKSAKNYFDGKEGLMVSYVDYTQLASFLENMGGMLNMFAPNPQGGALVDDKTLANLKQMGSSYFYSTVDFEDMALNFETGYIN